MKKVFKLLSLCIIASLIAGCSLPSLGEKTKTYTSHGISVTMNDKFYEKSLLSATVYLESTDSIFTALKEDFNLLSTVGITKDSTLREYAELVVKANQLSTQIIEEDGLTYFTYEKTVSGKDFYYLATVYKSNDAFWLINFACEKNAQSSFKPKFIKKKKTVTFAN